MLNAENLITLDVIDINTRKLRYFIAVAEELHFSRAASKLFVAQQALSRQIRDLETELGVRLFERTTRTVSLTPAGEAFLAGARVAIAAYDAAVETARQTARSLAGTLRVGYVPGAALELTVPILTEFAERHPDVVVEMHEFPSEDPTAGLATGQSDVAFIRLPQGTVGIETETLFIDPVVAMVSTHHRFADRTSVSARELAREPITLSKTEDEIYRDFWSLAAARDGETGTIIPISSVTEEVQVVAHGTAVAVTSAAVMRYTPVPGVHFLTIRDWPGSTTTVAWHTGERSSAVAGFVDVACAVRDRETELVRSIQEWLKRCESMG